MKYLLIILLLMSHVILAKEHPACGSLNNWAAMSAFTQLKNENLINNSDIYIDKTLVKRVASEEIQENLYRQVHEVIFYKKNETTIIVLAVNNASQEECSMSSVEIYLVSKKFGGE